MFISSSRAAGRLFRDRDLFVPTSIGASYELSGSTPMIVKHIHVPASREAKTTGFARFADDFLADWNPRFSGSYLQKRRATPSPKKRGI